MQIPSFFSPIALLLRQVRKSQTAYVIPFFCICLIGVSTALLEGFSFSFLLIALKTLGGGTAMIPLIGTWVEGWKQSHVFALFFALAVISQILRSALTYMAQLATTFLGASVQMRLQERIYAQIFRFSYRFISSYKTGDLVDYVTTCPQSVMIMLDSVNRLLVTLLILCVIIVFMCMISLPLTLLNIFFFVCAVISQRFVIRKITQASQKHANAVAELTKKSIQAFSGIKGIYLFGREKEMLQMMNKSLHTSAEEYKKMHIWNHFILPFNEVIGIFLVGISLLCGIFLLQDTATSLLPTLLIFLTLIYRFSTRVQVFMASLGSLSYYSGSFKRMEEILSEEEKEFASDEGSPFPGLNQSIVFESVSLKYPGKDEMALKDLSFTIDKGSITALVGHSGAGKTTVLEVLARLYEPLQGDIYVDNKNLRNYRAASWRNALGVVSQDAIIFNESIEENIRFGNRTASHEKIEEVAHLAGIHSFITTLPKGYETTVGERGYRLSGGEKQRIALARALVRDPEILILDEATSNLDSAAEYLILEALEKFRGKKTLIVVAHRLSTIAQADQILVIDKGKLVEIGTHQDLLQVGGRYQLFWDLQTKSKETAALIREGKGEEKLDSLINEGAIVF